MGRVVIVLWMIAPAVAGADAPPAPTLLDAYKKEFSFLEAEKQALQARLGALKARERRKVGGARARVDRLEKKLAALRAEAEQLERAARENERAVDRGDEAADLLIDALERARATLQTAGRDPGAIPEDAQAQIRLVAPVFQAAADMVREGAAVRTTPGSFFLGDGREVDGTIVHVGRVAAYGISDEGSGALAPAGGGHLMLWPADAAAAAQAMAAGDPVATLPLFLFETLDKRVEPKVEKTWLQIVESGGEIAWVIVWLGVVAAALLLARVLLLAWLALGSWRLVHRVRRLLDEGHVAQARAACERAFGSVGRVMRAALESPSDPREARESRVAEALRKEAPRVDRFGQMITVCAAVAPLLGLLGTVTGMIATFDIITEHGTGDPKLLAGGISEALITTELGLIVAIPTLLAGTLIGGRAKALLSRLEQAGLMVLNRVEGPSGAPEERRLLRAANG